MIVRSTNQRVAAILFMLLFAASCSDRGRHSPPSVELEEALLLSNAFLTTLNRDLQELKLIKVENRIDSGPGTVGPAIWRFDYLERRLIATKEHPLVGVGGGLFIEVDLETKKAKSLGVGE